MSNENVNPDDNARIPEESLSEVSGGAIDPSVRLVLFPSKQKSVELKTRCRTRKQRRLQRCLTREIPNREVPW